MKPAALTGPELPDRPGIYLILNRHNGRRWVGMAGRSLSERAKQHRRALNSGRAPAGRMGEDLAQYGPDAFVFLVLEVNREACRPGSGQLRSRERWWAQHLHALDQQQGYNLEAGGLRSPASLFRDCERKLQQASRPKYCQLPGVQPADPIDPRLLQAWMNGRSAPPRNQGLP